MVRLNTIKMLILAVLLLTLQTLAQTIKIDKIEPGNWWTKMKRNKVQLMVYGQNLSGTEARFNSPAIKVVKVHATDNPSYLFVDIEITNTAKAQEYVLTLSNKSGKAQTGWPLLERRNPEGLYAGFSPKDVIYMITPDRFADGDTKNDKLPGMIDTISVTSPIGRHGGDIQGMIDKLDYMKDLGVTAIWVNPVLENNTWVSYHGYGITNHYTVDPRFGTNELYRKFVDEAHKRGLKVILDHVNNHIGLFHPWSKSLPTADWYNGTVEKHEITKHHNRSFYDVHSTQTVRDKTIEGWFVDEMPDLNQKNPYLRNYLIQNTLWWIEYAGLDGIREDTYFYNNHEFLSEWAKAVEDEYPRMNIVGEIWIGEPVFLAPFQRNSPFNKSFNSYLPALADFPFRDAVADVFSGKETIFKLYETLAKDFLYTEPYNMMTFVDNHDVSRIMYMVKGDMKAFKMALQLLLTARGIPQIYYGTELGIVGKEDHGSIRENFMGGFPGDERNAFTREGRTEKENEIFDFIKKLISIRQSHKAFTEGKFYHFPPENDVYSYVRVAGDDKVLVVINNSQNARKLDLRFQSEFFPKDAKLVNLMDNSEVSLKGNNTLEIEAKTGGIFEIK